MGYYLPLQRSLNVRHFQEVTNYFAQFDQGIDRVNMYHAMMEFDRIRDHTLAIWDFVNDATSKWLRDREPILNLRSTTSSSSSQSRYQKPYIQREEFWKKDWNLHHSEALPFEGIPASGKQYEITSLMKMLVEFEDRFFQLISGYIPIPKQMHSTVHPVICMHCDIRIWHYLHAFL